MVALPEMEQWPNGSATECGISVWFVLLKGVSSVFCSRFFTGVLLPRVIATLGLLR